MFLAALAGLALAAEPRILQVDLPPTPLPEGPVGGARITLVGSWLADLPVVEGDDRICTISIEAGALEPMKAFACTDALFAKVGGLTIDWSVRTDALIPPREVARLSFLFPTAQDPRQGLFAAPVVTPRLGFQAHDDLERVWPTRSCQGGGTAPVASEDAVWCTVSGTEDWFGIPDWTAVGGCPEGLHAQALAIAGREDRPHCAWGPDGVPALREARTAAPVPRPEPKPEVK